MIMRVLLHMLYEIRIFDQHVRDLEEFETFVHDLLAVITVLHAAHINQRNIDVLQRLLEQFGFLHKV